MTFSNRREPTFGGAHPASPGGAQESQNAGLHASPHIAHADAVAHKAARPSGLTRVVSSVQIVGSLLAVPLGLASGYSMYKANFAVDTTCQNLRAGIIAMLDKNVDASTRRMLVRRDVSTFEQTCASFDPDAHAAFKVLLAAPPSAMASAAAPKLRAALPATEAARKNEPKSEAKAEAKLEPKSEPKLETKLEAKVETKAETKSEAKAESKAEQKIEAARAEAKLETRTDSKAEPKAESKAEAKAEPRQAIAEKPPAVVPVPASLESIEREAAISDTRWLAAVRQALTTNNPDAADKPSEPAAEVAAAKPAHVEAVAATKPAAPAVQLQPGWTVPSRAAASAAPAVVASAPAAAPLPVTAVPADVSTRVVPVRDDVPRPPAPITGPAPINGETDEGTGSRIGSWIAQIPLVGRVIEPRGN